VGLGRVDASNGMAETNRLAEGRDGLPVREKGRARWSDVLQRLEKQRSVVESGLRGKYVRMADAHMPSNSVE
jgi:CTP synthase (UTP-ammonia lyase)